MGELPLSKPERRQETELDDAFGATEEELSLRAGHDLKGVFPQSFSSEYLQIERGVGSYVVDQDGNWFMDTVAGSKNVNIGYGRTEVATAAFEQLSQLPYASSGYVTQPLIDLSEKLREFTPDEFEYLWLVSGGSLANESAFKMARQYHVMRGKPRKAKIISRRGSFHGNTAGAMAVSGSPQFMTMMDPLFPDFPKAPSGTPYRCDFCNGQGGESCGQRCADQLERLIQDEGAENVAGLITEPINSLTNAGAYPHEGYFERVREICNEYDVLLIADEIMTGFGRTGPTFAMSHWDVTPDIVTTGKGLSSGYAPVGAVLPHDRIVDEFVDAGAYAHSHTYCNNPTSAAISRTVLEYIETHNVYDHVAEVSVRLADRLSEFERYEMVGDVRGKGLIYGLELVEDTETKSPLDLDGPSVGHHISEEGMQEGLLLSTEHGHIGGEAGDVTIIAPPLTISEKEIDRLAAGLHRVFQKVEDRLDLQS